MKVQVRLPEGESEGAEELVPFVLLTFDFCFVSFFLTECLVEEYLGVKGSVSKQ